VFRPRHLFVTDQPALESANDLMSKSRTVFQNRGSVHIYAREENSTLYRAKFGKVLGLEELPRKKHFGSVRAMTALERTLVNGSPAACRGQRHSMCEGESCDSETVCGRAFRSRW
jgi:hypothetical protein